MPHAAEDLIDLARYPIHEDGPAREALLARVRAQLPEFTGAGLGKWLLTEATRAAWGLGASRVWLHTCTLDGPAALGPWVEAENDRPLFVT